MRQDATIMGGDEQWDLEYKIIHDYCGLDIRDYYSDMTIFTRQIFDNNFKKIIEVIERYANFKFHMDYQILGGYILLLGAKITEDLRDLIIEATNWWREEALGMQNGSMSVNSV